MPNLTIGRQANLKCGPAVWTDHDGPDGTNPPDLYELLRAWWDRMCRRLRV